MRVPLPGFVRRTVSRALDARITEAAAALTYFETMALVPTLVVSLSVASLVVANPRTTVDDLVTQLGGTSKGGLASALREIVSSLSTGGTASTLITIGAVTAIWSISGATSALLNIVGRMLGEVHELGIVRTRARGLVLAIVSAVAGALAIGCAVLIAGASEPIADRAGSDGLSTAIRLAPFPLILAGLACYLVIVFRMASADDPPVARPLILGALAGALLFSVFTIALAQYLARVGQNDAVAGSLAGLIVVLIWMYLSNLAVLAGAAICGQLRADRADITPATAPAPAADPRVQADPTAAVGSEVRAGRDSEAGPEG